MNPLFRPSRDDDVSTQAAGWIAALACDDSRSAVLLELNGWLREKVEHRVAFRQMERAWRLAKSMLVAGEPGAGRVEVQAFFDALEDERARRPKEFTDA